MTKLVISLLSALLFVNIAGVDAQMPNFKDLQDRLKSGMKDIQDKLKETPDSSKDIQAQSRRPAEVPQASADSRRSTQAKSSPESSWEKDLCALITFSFRAPEIGRAIISAPGRVQSTSPEKLHTGELAARQVPDAPDARVVARHRRE